MKQIKNPISVMKRLDSSFLCFFGKNVLFFDEKYSFVE